MKYSLFYISVLLSNLLIAQESISDILMKYNDKTIPYISVEELHDSKDVIILDAREKEEYNISHIKNAHFVGYKNFKITNLAQLLNHKNQRIVVYCSLGVRSEDIAKKLKKEGYTNVFNLHGGIFQWKNNDYSVYNTNNKITENVHVFSEQWSKWLTKGEKVYE